MILTGTHGKRDLQVSLSSETSCGGKCCSNGWVLGFFHSLHSFQCAKASAWVSHTSLMPRHSSRSPLIVTFWSYYLSELSHLKHLNCPISLEFWVTNFSKWKGGPHAPLPAPLWWHSGSRTEQSLWRAREDVGCPLQGFGFPALLLSLQELHAGCTIITRCLLPTWQQ